LSLTQADHDQFKAQGRKPHWRFKLEERTMHWNDLVRGESHIEAGSLSDPVLIREDGTYLYTLPSVVDDIDLGITHVIRGEDHVTNTAVQIQLFETLVGKAPIFGHHNLLTTASGEGLSKRSGALSIASLRQAGIEPLAIAALATLTGSSDAVHPVASLQELGGLFDLSHVSRGAARFDENELATLSARTLHAMAFADVSERLVEAGVFGAKAEAFWLAVRGNLETFSDVREWWRVVEQSSDPIIEDADYCKAALALLPDEPYDAQTWSRWTGAIKEQTGRKGKMLFHPLRLALTGKESGPELAQLLPLMGRVKAAARLSGQSS
jgi:glutamyl-tRNA synthetase